MAKKKITKGTRRRRRVGAALNFNSPLIKLAAVAGGYFLTGRIVNEQVDKLVKGKVSDMVVGAGETGLGAFLLLGGRSSMIKTIVGGVAAGAGLRKLVPSVMGPAIPAVSGYGSVPVIGGYGSVPVIGSHMGGYTPSGTLGNYAIPSGRIGGVMGGIGGSDLLGSN